LYQHATAMAYPSLYEGFGLPVLEAMACGCPVITSNLSSLPEVGGHAVLYVEPQDQASILKALESFENDPNLYERLRQDGLKQAQIFTWESCALKTVETYTKCLTGSPNGLVKSVSQ
jgi:glycosyltransferase involved in cell wall biosynthesis